ncbi:hypothetical protein IAE35_21570 [Pseudomonas sp. S75]|uniref:hypothetical protein n=1 Tax=unclassified Pseudomonas TaxID=196821 RepID=UPI001903C1A2|nr:MULTISPECIES: hypothetical protein [unclassified Pseudomonas]MBJ9978106.1 hypothetical protein [Pseudomonas sp. S30]MBK0155937.1 hypothetical protein [Pseudomonas sp. S75]
MIVLEISTFFAPDSAAPSAAAEFDEAFRRKPAGRCDRHEQSVEYFNPRGLLQLKLSMDMSNLSKGAKRSCVSGSSY